MPLMSATVQALPESEDYSDSVTKGTITAPGSILRSVDLIRVPLTIIAALKLSTTHGYVSEALT